MKSPEMGMDDTKVREKAKEGITFHVAETGLETKVDEVVTDKEFSSREDKDFAPNRTWYSITVANESDMKKWIDLRNEYLACAWTPNQDTEERTENAKRMKDIEIEMRSLEQK